MARKQNLTADSIKRDSSTRSCKLNCTQMSKGKLTTVISEPSSSKEERVDLDAGGIQLPPKIRGPKIEAQLSVFSTDSGFLPKDIQDSSFVDDVIEELNIKGISHSDIICYHGCQTSGKELQEGTASCKKYSSFCKQTSKLACQDDAPTKKKPLILPTTKSKVNVERRLRNNEASRRSRACRKTSTWIKEEEVAKLEEENQRLTILLKDFNGIAASCKQWIVQKMENPEQMS